MGRGADQRGGRTKEHSRGAALGGLGIAQKKRPMATKQRENGRPTIRGRGETCVAGRAQRPEERTKDATNAASPLKSEGGGGHAEDNGPNKRHNNGEGSGLEGRGAAGRTTRHTPRRDATQGTDHAGGAPAPTEKGRCAAANKRQRVDPAGRKKGAA